MDANKMLSLNTYTHSFACFFHLLKYRLTKINIFTVLKEGSKYLRTFKIFSEARNVVKIVPDIVK